MKKWKTLVWAFCFAWRLDKKMLLACFGINAVISVMPAAVLHYNQQVIAGITEFAGRGNGTFEEIAGGIIALGLAMTVYGLSNRINGDLLYMVMYDSYYLGMEEALMEKIQRIPYKVLKQRKTQEEYIAVINRAGSLTDLTSALCVLSGRILTAVSLLLVVIRQSVWSFWIVLITFASTVWILCRVHVLIVVILLITCIPAVILAAVQKDETYRASTKWMTEGVWVIHQFFMCCGTESLNEVRHLGIFLFLKERWKKYSQEYLEKKNALTRKHVLYNSAADILRNVVYIGVLLLAAHEIFQNPGMGVGVFMLVLNSSSQFQKVTAQIFTGIVQIYSDIYFMKDFFDLEKLYHVPPVQKEKKMNGYDIDFSGITFTYPGKEVPALRDISLKIREGEKIAIVGENGSGKTTFVNLLCGLYAPQQGQVSIGGRNVNGKLDLVRNLVAVVFQDFGKYEESIRRNITVSDRSREKDDGFLYGLLKLVGLEEQVREFPDGLDEVMGVLSENGKNLSGGQWQKLALARALNRSEAKIMILDEPTAAMDAEAETELYRNFTDVTGDRTTLLISHRLGVTKLVDRILVFKDGCVIENGSHQELMEQKGEYARMYQAQAEWYA